MPKPKLVKVTWMDATTKYEQMLFTEAIEKCTVETRCTVGWLIHKSTERILLAHTIDIDVDPPIYGTDYTSLPTHWATNIEELET